MRSREMDFLALEDEVSGVEHLLVEPKYNDLGDGVLGFDTFNLQKCFNIEEFSAVDYGYIKTDGDALCSSFILGEKTNNEFLDGKTDKTNDGLFDGINNLPDTCEDYLLDTEFGDDMSNLNCVPSNGSCVENLALDHHTAGSGERQCDDEIVELSTTSCPLLEATCYKKSSLLDGMTIDELHAAFRNMFGRETAVTDKQWLKHRISFGLQNLDALNSGLSFSECLMTSKQNEGETGLSTSDEHLCRVSSPLTSVFNFKTKPRGRHLRRERRTGSYSVKTLSSDVSKFVFGLPDLGGKEGVLVTRRRSRRPTQRYIEESLEPNSRFQRRKCGVSNTFPKDKNLCIGSDMQHLGKRPRLAPLICWKDPLEAAYIQVPFGLPVKKGPLQKKGHESEGYKDCRLLGSYVDSDMEPHSVESEADMSADDCSRRIKTHKGKSRRKNHMLWSLPEVSKLVEGVSKYGVGRWTEIKRVLFPSSAHRTSVDLKDKWRNLLRASCTRPQGKRGVVPRLASQSIPQPILHRVRELAVIFPYPRERKNKVFKTVTTTSPMSAPTCNNLSSLSTAVKVEHMVNIC